MFPQIWLLLTQNDKNGQDIRAFISFEAAQAAIAGPGLYRIEPLGVQGLQDGEWLSVGPRAQPAQAEPTKPALRPGEDLHDVDVVRDYISRTTDVEALRRALDWAYQTVEAPVDLRSDVEGIQRLLGLIE